MFIFLTGLTLGVFLVVQATMIADAVDDVERRTGVRNDGVSFATLTFVSKIMSALAVLVFGVFVVVAGYQQGRRGDPRDAEHRVHLDDPRAGALVPRVGGAVPVLSALGGKRWAPSGAGNGLRGACPRARLNGALPPDPMPAPRKPSPALAPPSPVERAARRTARVSKPRVIRWVRVEGRFRDASASGRSTTWRR